MQDEWQLNPDQVAEFKEVFMLFDKDEDGVITFPEVIMVMKSLGQRPSGIIPKYYVVVMCEMQTILGIADEELLEMVRDVSEDKMYDTIEFNEFLQMMSKQQRKGLSQDTLKDAFRYRIRVHLELLQNHYNVSKFSRIFDKDDDGFISVEELRSIMKNLGDKMTDEELDEMLDTADTKHDGLINYSG